MSFALVNQIARDSLDFTNPDKLTPSDPRRKPVFETLEEIKRLQARLDNLNKTKNTDVFASEAAWQQQVNKLKVKINNANTYLQELLGEGTVEKTRLSDVQPKTYSFDPQTNVELIDKNTSAVYSTETPVERVGNWTRAEVEADKGYTYLFGDNTADRASGVVPTQTQAVIRGLDNAVGIDTRLSRTKDWVDTDANYNKFTQHVDEQIQKALDMGKPIKVSAGGMGTGMAKALPPRFKEYLDNAIKNIGYKCNTI